MKLRELLAKYSPTSVWDIPGVSHRGTAAEILANAGLEDYLVMDVEYLRQHHAAISAGLPTATTGDIVARKVR